MESPVVTEWGLSVMKILAVLQYNISYHINYIATGSRAFCDTDIGGGGYKISSLCRLQAFHKVAFKDEAWDSLVLFPLCTWAESKRFVGNKE